MWKLLQTQDSLKNCDPFVHNNRNGSFFIIITSKGCPKFRLKDFSG